MSRIGIIAALPAEAKSLHNKNIDIATPVEIEKNIFLSMSGMGHDAATKSADKLLKLDMDALISWGVAGAINDSVKPGNLLIAGSIIGQEYEYAAPAEWISSLNAYFIKSNCTTMIAPITSTTKLCTSVKAKKYLAQKTGALAVDMESAAIAEIAKVNHIKYIVLRAIADDVKTNMPEAVIKHTDILGRPRLVGFMSSCLINPTQIKDMLKLARCYKSAIRTLKKIAPDLKKQHFLYNS